jgi:uncharacterized coiled-coil protein SlyX
MTLSDFYLTTGLTHVNLSDTVATVAAQDAPVIPKPPSEVIEWGVLGALLFYIFSSWIGPLMKSSTATQTAETKRVDDLIKFQQEQLKELTAAISKQTEVVNQQTATVASMVNSVDNLVEHVNKWLT